MNFYKKFEGEKNLLKKLNYLNYFFWSLYPCYILFGVLLLQLNLKLIGYSLLFLIFLSLLLSYGTYKYSSNYVLKKIDGKPWYEPNITKIARDLSIKFSCKTPEIYHIDSEIPNALTLGTLEAPKLVVTQGILNLSMEEIEAILAHEFYHISCNDAFIKTFTSLTSKILFFDPISRFVDKNLFELKEFLADEASAIMTKNPKNLASALRKIYLGIPETLNGIPQNAITETLSNHGTRFPTGIPAKPFIRNRLIVNRKKAEESKIDERVERLMGMKL